MTEDYIQYYQKILKTVQEDLQTNKLTTAQLIIIFLSLTQAQTKEQLKAAIEKLAEKYPNLNEIEFKEQAEIKVKKEEIIQKIVLELITGGKSKDANEFSSYANSHSLSEVQTTYPQYFN